MSKVLNPNSPNHFQEETNPEFNPELQLIQDSETIEKMKRMSVAVKAVGGWFSYFMGVSALGFGLLTPLGTDIFSIVLGTIITLTGLTLLGIHIKQKDLHGKALTVKLIKYSGAMLLIPGFLGSRLTGLGAFRAIFLAGLIIFITSIVLRNRWGLKPVRKTRSI